MIKMFWNDSELNIGVASSDAIEAPLNSVLDKFYDLSEAENSREFNKQVQIYLISS